MNILYISESFVDLPLFASQVHTLCNLHSEEDKVTLLALCTKNEMSKDIEGRRYTLIKKRKSPKMIIPIINRLFASFFTDKKLLEECDVIHCRGYIGSAYAINICKKYNINKPIIADIRGEVVEELKYSKSRFALFTSKQASKLEKFIFNSTPFFFFVSENMRNHYADKYSFNKKNTLIVSPIVDKKYFYQSTSLRNEFRHKLGIGNQLVYVYVGGAEYWQNLDKVLMKFDQVVKIDPKIFLLVITKDIDVVKEMISDHNLNSNNIKVLSLQYAEVGKYLNACDVGIMMRGSSLMSKVATPIKISEYLACHLKVVDKLEEIGNREYTNKPYTYIPVTDNINNQKKAYKNFISKSLQEHI